MKSPDKKIVNNKIKKLFSGHGITQGIIVGLDWSNHPLGNIENWPQSLISAYSICANSNFPIAIYWGRDLHLLYNDAWSPIPGKKHPWAIGKGAKEVWPEIWADIRPLFDEAISTGKATGSKDALLPMDRHGYVEECYFDFTFTPIYGESGQVDGIFNAVIETTYRVISERRSNFVKNISSQLIGYIGEKELFSRMIKVLSTNRLDIPFAAIYSYENEEWKEKSLINVESYEFTKLFDKNPESIIIPRSLDEQELSRLKISVINNPWEEKVNQAYYSPIIVNEKTVGCFLFGISSRLAFNDEYLRFFEEISNIFSSEMEEHQVLIQERKRTKELEALDKAKTVFFSNISHEFRTPLTLMLSPLEELLNNSSTEISKINRNHIETTHRNALRLLKLVNNLLDFSRLESGRHTASFSLQDVSSYTKDLASNFRSMMEKAGLEFVIKADEIIQPVYIDKTMWEKIVFNLLSNAIKYTLTGKVSVTVTSTKQHALLMVEDTGIGIPEEELPKMFERFHRVENSSGRTHEGTGIGLSLIKGLIKLHGGKISVTSKLGQGSCFTVTIPFGKDHILSEQISKEEGLNFDVDNFIIEEAAALFNDNEKHDQSTVSAEDKATILLVDDNSDMRNHIKSLLESKYNVQTAANGMEALHKIKEGEIILVISDIMMPIMDGFQLVKAIKNNPKSNHIPIVLISARAGEEAQIEGLEAGADDYLVKPFSSKELTARVGAQINMIKKREEETANIKNIVTQSPVAMTLLLGKEMIIKIANEKALEVWGKKLEDVINLPAMQAFPELVQQGFGKILDDVYSSGNPFIANELPVTLIRHGKPETVYINFKYQPLRDKHNVTNGIVGIGVDVTEQVNARKMVEVSDARFKAAVKAVRGVIWTNNHKGEMEGEQSAWAELTGQSFEEYQGYGWANAVHPEDAQPTIDAWNEAVKERKTFIFEHRVKTKNGSYESFSIQAIPVLEADGSIREWVGVHTHL